MTKAANWTLVLLVSAVFCGYGAAQNTSDRSSRSEEKTHPAESEDSIPTEGFWPTKTMMNSLFDRMVEDMAERYELDADQLERTRDIIKERIPAFMQENRAQIQRLMNEFIEVQLSGKAPEVDHVTVWAQRALPLINKFKGVVDESTADIRQFMTDDQQLKLDSEKAAFDAGIGIAINKVGGWSEGAFDPKTEWPENEDARRQKEREERTQAKLAMAEAKQSVLDGEGPVRFDADVQPDDEVAVIDEAAPPVAVVEKPDHKPAPAKPVKTAAKDEWTRYVEDFIKRYELTVDQQNAARRSLEKRKEDRTAYLKRPKTQEQMDSIERRLKETKSKEDRAVVEKELAQLNAPIDRYFQQLKDDLDKIPTRQQRAKAGKSASANDDGRSTPSSHGNSPEPKVTRRGTAMERAEEKGEGPSSP